MLINNKNYGSYNLHTIKTDKFKSIMVKVSFRRPIKKQEITMRNILCNMLTQSSNNYKTKRQMAIKAQDLYAASISTVIAYALMFIYRWIDVKKYVKFNVNKILMFALTIMYGITIFTYYLKNTMISVVVLVIVVVFAIITNLNSVSYLKQIVKDKIKK